MIFSGGDPLERADLWNADYAKNSHSHGVTERDADAHARALRAPQEHNVSAVSMSLDARMRRATTRSATSALLRNEWLRGTGPRSWTFRLVIPCLASVGHDWPQSMPVTHEATVRGALFPQSRLAESPSRPGLDEPRRRMRWMRRSRPTRICDRRHRAPSYGASRSRRSPTAFDRRANRRDALGAARHPRRQRCAFVSKTGDVYPTASPLSAATSAHSLVDIYARDALHRSPRFAKLKADAASAAIARSAADRGHAPTRLVPIRWSPTPSARTARSVAV